MLSDPTHTLDRSSQRRSWTRSFSLSYDFLLTNALLAQIEHPRSLMPNSVQLSRNLEESLMPICANCRGIAMNRANALILFVANPVPVPVLISNALILFVANPVPAPVLICAWKWNHQTSLDFALDIFRKLNDCPISPKDWALTSVQTCWYRHTKGLCLNVKGLSPRHKGLSPRYKGLSLRYKGSSLRHKGLCLNVKGLLLKIDGTILKGENSTCSHNYTHNTKN